jgi:hypothetical protein
MEEASFLLMIILSIENKLLKIFNIEPSKIGPFFPNKLKASLYKGPQMDILFIEAPLKRVLLAKI